MLELAPDNWTPVEAAHLLQRAGFSGTLPQISVFHARGRREAVEWLLEEAATEELPQLPVWASHEARQLARRQYVKQREELVELRDEQREGSDRREQIEDRLRQLNRRRNLLNQQQSSEAVEWWFRLMCTSSGGLREQMTLFWHDHFACGVDKVNNPALMVEQNQLLRRHALGNFRELVHEIAEDPAMVIYLDLHRSSSGHPNENFARELMELFVLGEGAYREADILELARALTGFGLNASTGTTSFNPSRHDDTEKTIFGQRAASPVQAIDLVLDQPATAPHMAAKIWTWFAGDSPSDLLGAQLATEMARRNFEIRPFLNTLFRSRAFYHEAVMQRRIKSPLQLLASFCRQFGLPGIPRDYLVGSLARLGQIPFMPPNVAGWDGGRSWINGDVLLARYNVLGELVRPGWRGPMLRGRLEQSFAVNNAAAAMREWPGPNWRRFMPVEQRHDREKLLNNLLFVLFGDPLADTRRDELMAWLERSPGATVSTADLSELTELLISTPHYQLG